MTLQQFKYLDEDTQDHIFLQKGVQVAERREPGYIYHLYQIDGFYIEAEYSITFNRVNSLIAFDAMHKLDPYLRLIPVTWLL